MIERMVIGEHIGDEWTINFGEYNHETDVTIPKSFALELLKIKEEFNRLKSRNEELEAKEYQLRDNIERAYADAKRINPDYDWEGLTQTAQIAVLGLESLILRLKAKVEELEAENERLQTLNDQLFEADKPNLREMLEASQKIDRLTSALGAAHEALGNMLHQIEVYDVSRHHAYCPDYITQEIKKQSERCMCDQRKNYLKAKATLSDPSGSLAFEKWKKMNEIIEHEKIIRKKTDEVDLLMSDDLKRMDKLLCELEALDAKGERE